MSAWGELVIVSTRAHRVESEHAVSVAVVDQEGRLVASAGDAARRAYWRSAAKPIQALACVRDGAAARFGFGPEELALACASHSSESVHVALAQRMLAACDASEEDLACGGHPPLAPAVHEELIRNNTVPTPTMSNCSGKHAAMIALARHHGWSVQGYAHVGHPVQSRILEDVCALTGLGPADLGTAGDGCRAVTWHLPLTAMARAWAHLGSSDDPALAKLRTAMATHPFLVAGTGRACTAFLEGGSGRLLVKVGAEGIYCAALPQHGLGLALKVHSGDWRATPVALAAVLSRLDAQFSMDLAHQRWASFARPPVLDTRGDTVGFVEARGELAFH